MTARRRVFVVGSELRNFDIGSTRIGVDVGNSDVTCANFSNFHERISLGRGREDNAMLPFGFSILDICLENLS